MLFVFCPPSFAYLRTHVLTNSWIQVQLARLYFAIVLISGDIIKYVAVNNTLSCSEVVSRGSGRLFVGLYVVHISASEEGCESQTRVECCGENCEATVSLIDSKNGPRSQKKTWHVTRLNQTSPPWLFWFMNEPEKKTGPKPMCVYKPSVRIDLLLSTGGHSKRRKSAGRSATAPAPSPQSQSPPDNREVEREKFYRVCVLYFTATTPATHCSLLNATVIGSLCGWIHFV